MRLACDLRRLFRLQSFCNQFFRVWFNVFLEKETCEGDGVVQSNQSLADQRSYFEQRLVIDFESRVNKIGLDAPRQVLSCEETDVSPIKVIELLEVDRSRRGRQMIDTKSFEHVIECHYIIFSDAPTHERNPVQDTFGNIP